MWLEGGNWIHLAQVQDQWKDVMSTLMNLWVPLKVANPIEHLSGCSLLKRAFAPWSWLFI
jgi:hypothetical protein